MKTTYNRQLELSQRVLAVKSERLLDQIDEILVKAEMQARFEESLDDIANGRTVTIKEFRKDCVRWFSEKMTNTSESTEKPRMNVDWSPRQT